MAGDPTRGFGKPDHTHKNRAPCCRHEIPRKAWGVADIERCRKQQRKQRRQEEFSTVFSNDCSQPDRVQRKAGDDAKRRNGADRARHPGTALEQRCDINERVCVPYDLLGQHGMRQRAAEIC